MQDIYDRFDSATRGISAAVLFRDGKAVGRAVVKHGAAVTAYFQIWGAEMVCGRAGGGGYDREGAAMRGAIRKLAACPADRRPADPVNAAAFAAVMTAADAPEGQDWQSALRGAGFTVEAAI